MNYEFSDKLISFYLKKKKYYYCKFVKSKRVCISIELNSAQLNNDSTWILWSRVKGNIHSELINQKMKSRSNFNININIEIENQIRSKKN